MEHEHDGYLIVTADNPHYKRIRAIKQGSIPTILSGLYTTMGEAKRAIDIYKASFKGKSNGKKQSDG